MKNLVELRWPVDVEGYEVVSVTIPPTNVLAASSDPHYVPKETELVVPRGGVMEPRDPLENTPLLVHELARTPKTPDGVCKFAGKHGLLSLSRARGELPDDLPFSGTPKDELIYRSCGEDLDFWYSTIDLVSDALFGLEKRRE